MNNSVKLIKAVSITYTSYSGSNTKKYTSPVAAAKEWASNAVVSWVIKTFPMESWSSIDRLHPGLIDTREKRYYKKAFPIFKRMLA
jgi:hypothetical protein